MNAPADPAFAGAEGFMERVGALDEHVGLDTVNHGSMGSYAGQYPWQASP